jgi:hypothetical protein
MLAGLDSKQHLVVKKWGGLLASRNNGTPLLVNPSVYEQCPVPYTRAWTQLA